MPNARSANAVRLEFAPGALVHANLSGAALSGDWLWVVGSHGLKRKNTKEGRDHTENANRLLLGLRGPVLRGWSALVPGQPSWLVLYDAPGADRKDGEYTVFGDLLRHASIV